MEGRDVMTRDAKRLATWCSYDADSLYRRAAQLRELAGETPTQAKRLALEGAADKVEKAASLVREAGRTAGEVAAVAAAERGVADVR